MEERIKEMKKYVGRGESSRIMFLLSGIFLAVAVVLTLAGVALGFSYRRLGLLAVLWVVAVGMLLYSMVETVKNKRDTDANFAAIQDMESVAADFESATKLYADQLRMGQKYLFAARSGGVIAYSDIRSASMSRIAMKENNFFEFSVMLADGKQRTIFRQNESYLDKRVVAEIIMHLNQKAPEAKILNNIR